MPDADVLVALNRSATAARLLSGAVHEVNNALMVISGTVELLEARPDLPPNMADALARLRAQSGRAATALAEVLSFIRTPAGELTLVNLRDAASRAVELRRFAIKRVGLAVRFDADEQVTFTTRGNRGALQQAILNLIVNAEQALAGTQGGITVEVVEDGARVGIRVRDTGRGIPPEVREQLFQPFVTTRAPHEGAGLGLWVARTIAVAHGGTLEVEEATEGASLVMWLPRAS